MRSIKVTGTGDNIIETAEVKQPNWDAAWLVANQVAASMRNHGCNIVTLDPQGAQGIVTGFVRK